MKRITPDDVYLDLPCSMVAVGCALGDKGAVLAAEDGLRSPELHSDGYLSLDGLNRLIRANMAVKKMEYFKRGERPTLYNWAHEHIGQRAVICLLGHYIYFNGYDYFSYFENDDDPVVKVWYI